MCLDTRRWVAAESKTILSLRCFSAPSVFLNVYFNYHSLCLLLAANKYVFIHSFQVYFYTKTNNLKLAALDNCFDQYHVSSVRLAGTVWDQVTITTTGFLRR